ncbi:response regulator transcription factor [Actinophytocola algeriensis]|uniref:Two-component system response regulator DesR n=1 Tax=Actinophytocola algeriensis TaxID=1768010 RepID=A0A7W7QGC0_9PSEU|nr:response regulator transcription factor [Actinophytocola algeriensis]MBB4912859.1 two-component system response regulator DesR [Actinophytocola algeriensis]MBE1474107.1 two-component system response regulator DesR [Actinophytocola algeriensis]
MIARTFPANGVLDLSGEPATEPITVLLALNLGLVRGAFVDMLSRHGDIEIVAALECGDQVVPLALRERPDVVVIEIDTPSSIGLTTVGNLREQLPACQIVALAAARPASVARSLLAADVLGAIDKDAPAHRLLEAIRGAAKGQAVVDASLAVAALMAESNPLTPREVDVLRMAADGAPGPEIAKRLFLSPGTVRNYLSNVTSKTRARSKSDAVRIARESGWV